MSVLGSGSSSPFLAADSFEMPAEGESPAASAPPGPAAYESPFLRSYLRDGEDPAVDPEAEEFAAFLAELYEPGLDDALLRLAGEAAAEHAELESGDGGAVYTDLAAVRQLMDDRYAPLVRELESAIDAVAEAGGERALHAMDENEVDTLFEAFAAPPGGHPPGSPSFEFLFGIGNVLKKVAKGAVGLAKRGLKVVANLALGPLLAKLKPIAVALLRKAVAAGLKWLPEGLRPYAQKLAERLPLLGAGASETGDDTGRETVDATGDVRELQAEFGMRAADTVFADTEAAMDRPGAEYAREADRAAVRPDPVAELDRARERFIAELGAAEDGTDLTPQLEQFLPAALPVLKLALKLTGGRSVLVKTLAKFVAPLIRRFVGPTAAAALSRALVDAGLRLIHLEAGPEDERQAAGAAMASVVEDTVRGVAALPEHILADDTLLEGFVLEAFEQAAARNLPQILTEATYQDRPELREDLTLRGAWLPKPLRGRHRYRKYTRIPWVTVSPYQAAHIGTFCGLNLGDTLRSRLGYAPGAPVRARMHLYEAVPGTTLDSIMRGEGLEDPEGELSETPVLHPLTPDAAALLLGEPALGEEAEARYMDGQLLGVGQRLYYLEAADAGGAAAAEPGGALAAQPVAAPAPAARHTRAPASRPGRVRINLGCTDDTLRAELYLTEAEAQRLAAGLRQGRQAGQLLAPLIRPLRRRIRAALTGHGLRIVHGAVPPGAGAAALRTLPAGALNRLAATVEEALTRGLATLLKDHREAFTAATEAPEDGATVRVVLKAAPVLARVRSALDGRPERPGRPAAPAAMDVTVTAGHATHRR